MVDKVSAAHTKAANLTLYVVSVIGSINNLALDVCWHSYLYSVSETMKERILASKAVTEHLRVVSQSCW
jgi:hypothetical protein